MNEVKPGVIKRADPELIVPLPSGATITLSLYDAAYLVGELKRLIEEEARRD